MDTTVSPLAVTIFLAFVGLVLGLSFYLARRAKSASGYFAAHGEIGWFVNGIAFAGDYLSAASFLGIVGMIALEGYDGFLYSLGFLAGWVVALFLIAEPFKKLGRYTFADAIDAKFQSRGLRLTAAVSTLVVSMFYLIPQMVGAGALIKPLLNLDQIWGILIVGSLVITIVTTAGMVSTTWVQFIKGSMLVVFCGLLVIMLLNRGLTVTAPVTGTKVMTPARAITALADGKTSTGPLNPITFITELRGATVTSYSLDKATGVYMPGAAASGSTYLIPGGHFKGMHSPLFINKLDFISLMVALFCGTASLPHILIRYYTVKDASAARKSTVIGIAAIGGFYILAFYIGLGAMVSGKLPFDSNMAAPYLARSFGDWEFACLTAIAFTTILGTVSGLILAASGAVAHDIIESFFGREMDDHAKVKAAKYASVVVGVIAMGLGYIFRDLNVGFLVGWAFNVAASANLPAIVMLLFWGRTTRQGMIVSIAVGLISSVTWLLLTKEACVNVYGLTGSQGIAPFSQPGIVTIPLAFLTLVVVSFLTPRRVPIATSAYAH